MPTLHLFASLADLQDLGEDSGSLSFKYRIHDPYGVPAFFVTITGVFIGNQSQPSLEHGSVDSLRIAEVGDRYYYDLYGKL